MKKFVGLLIVIVALITVGIGQSGEQIVLKGDHVGTWLKDDYKDLQKLAADKDKKAFNKTIDRLLGTGGPGAVGLNGFIKFLVDGQKVTVLKKEDGLIQINPEGCPRLYWTSIDTLGLPLPDFTRIAYPQPPRK